MEEVIFSSLKKGLPFFNSCHLVPGFLRVSSITVDIYHALYLILYYLPIDSNEVLWRNCKAVGINTAVVMKILVLFK